MYKPKQEDDKKKVIHAELLLAMRFQLSFCARVLSHSLFFFTLCDALTIASLSLKGEKEERWY